MSFVDALMALSEGNPGAATALMHLCKDSPSIDPDDMFKELGPVIALDNLGIYGPRIWMLYKDVCQHSTIMVLAILRAYQLGQLEGCTEKAINHAIDNMGEGLNLASILAAVQRELPDFNKKTTTA